MGLDLSFGSGWRGLSVLVVSPTPTHPQDYGNRKRIYEICKRLKSAGAQVHFLHYPSEAEWRGRVPRLAEAQMRAAWDSYVAAPPTRPLHSSPAGDVHEIDEWWDPSIGTQLSWIFETRHIDVMIVNYTWLSNAFAYAPHGVYKILDTHDYFSSRKQLLQANGIAPEFFYMSREAEAAAFARADMVWAIKHEEATVFRSMTDRPVITMLHSEPGRKLAGETAPDPDGYLRLGIVGARNNINLSNFKRFYAIARERFIDALAPIKLVLVGSWTEDLREFEDDPIIELRGRVPDLTDFYASVDAVLVAMEFSTGLKIKTGEAIAYGKPIIAHAHAFEGYPARHRFHRLKSFEAVADACIDLSYMPSMLNDLRTASIVARQDLDKEVAAAFSETVKVMTEARQPLLVVCNRSICATASLRHQFLVSNAEYLKALASMVIYIDGQLTVGEVEKLRTLGVQAPVVVTPETYKSMLQTSAAEDLRALDVGPDRLKQLIDRRSVRQLLVLDPVEGLVDAMSDDVTLYLQLDMIRAGGGGREQTRSLAAAAGQAGKVVAFTTGDSNAVTSWRHVKIDEYVRTPFFYNLRDVELFKRWWVATPTGGLILASGSDADLKLVKLIADRTDEKLLIVISDGKHLAKYETDLAGYPEVSATTLDAFCKRPHATIEKPAVALDLCPRDWNLGLVREILDRNEIPLVIYASNPAAPPSGMPQQIKLTPWKLVVDFLEALESTTFRNTLRVGRYHAFRNDEGWAYIWRTMRNS